MSKKEFNSSVSAPSFLSGRHQVTPQNGNFTGAATNTGAITVALPSGVNTCMVSMWVDVFVYTAARSFSFYICGYTFSTPAWFNVTAKQIGGDTQYAVRFTRTAGGQFLVQIGETTTTWAYPNVLVRDVRIGHAVPNANWENDWVVSVAPVETLVDVTVTTQYHPSEWTLVAGKPTSFTPATHSHAQSDITGLATSLAAKLDTSAYTASDVLSKLLTVDGTGTSLDADLLDGQHASAFATATHAHAWADITGKPATFTPAAHTHPWSEVTSKPTTFTPAAHTHPQTEVTNLVSDLASKVSVNSVRSLLNNENADNITLSGTYSIELANGSGNTNFPDYGYGVFVVHDASSFIVQRYTKHINGSPCRIWERCAYKTTPYQWSTWTEVATSGGLSFTSTASKVRWDVNTDFAEIGFKNDANTDTDSYFYINGGDDASDGIVKFMRNGTAYASFNKPNDRFWFSVGNIMLGPRETLTGTTFAGLAGVQRIAFSTSGQANSGLAGDGSTYLATYINDVERFEVNANGVQVNGSIGITNTASNTGTGIRLYGDSVNANGEPTYGIMFAGTATFGTHGNSSTWATYLTNGGNHGWIFRNNASGNVASINAYGELNVNGSAILGGALSVGGRQFVSMPNPVSNTRRGRFHPLIAALRATGRALWGDEDFIYGSNNVQPYNNSGGSAVTIARELGTGDLPNSSGYWLKITHTTGTASPGRGGFLLPIPAKRDKTFVQIFQAMLPVGRNFVLNENSQGNGALSYWLTDTSGTGMIEWYARVSHCGDGGTFSGGGHVYVDGPATAFNTFIYSCEVYDITATRNFWELDRPIRSVAVIDATYLSNYSEGLRIAPSSAGYAGLYLGTTTGFTGTQDGQWSLARKNSGKLSIWHNADETQNGVGYLDLNKDGSLDMRNQLNFYPSNGGTSEIVFRNTGTNNDMGWIRHVNSSGTSFMQFCVSDDTAAGSDYFAFGGAAANGTSGTAAAFTAWATFAQNGFTLSRNTAITGTLSASGAVTLGSTLTVTGDVTGSAFTGTNFTATSDERLKECVEELQDSEDVLSQLRVVTYLLKKGGSRHVGLIAQEVERLYPEHVYVGADGMRSLDYNSIIFRMLDSIDKRLRKAGI